MSMLCVRFFTREGAKLGHRLVHEWLFDEARALDISGGTVYRAAAGYGRHGLHQDSFFELAGSLPESIEFAADQATVEALVERVGAAGLKLVYVTHVVDVGVTGG